MSPLFLKLQRTGALCLLCAFVLMDIPAHAADAPFPDMDRSWFGYHDSVAYLRDAGAIGGYPDGNFKPKETVNRAELLKIVFLARGGPAPVGGNCFPDVTNDAWYAPFVCAASRRNIVKGYPDGTFKPEQPVNFAEAIKIVLLAYGKDIEERGGSKWYEPYTDVLDDDDILPRHSYLPWEPLTRERAADLVARFVRHETDGTVANLSDGCGKDPRDMPGTISVNGVERSFLLTQPDRYVSHDPHPLIIAFHGRTNSNEQVRAYYGLDREADGYFIAYPAALRNGNNSFSWSNPGDKLSTLRDLAFFDALVESIGDRYCIDMDRIYVVGHSLGAWMTNSVACARADVIRASATVGGDGMNAPCAGPVAALVIHNPNDTLSPFSGSERIRDARVEKNACDAESTPTPPESLNCQTYRNCDGGNTVMWCPHEINMDRNAYYPHQWPTGTADTIVKFFAGLQD